MDVTGWLMRGDPAVAWQCARDLLGQDRPDLRARIAHEGQGGRLMVLRHADGWGDGYYRPRWACINGMFLNFACAFGLDQAYAAAIIDWLLTQRLADGGWNCRLNRSGARHSSLHSTLSVLEGLAEYSRAGHAHRAGEARDAARAGRAFILQHRFFRSDHTGRIIRPEFLRLPYPPRWRYNILRALDHFRAVGYPYNPAMNDALAEIAAKRRADGRWPIFAAQKGDTLRPEKGPGASRWATLLALRVLGTYGAAARAEPS